MQFLADQRYFAGVTWFKTLAADRLPDSQGVGIAARVEMFLIARETALAPRGRDEKA